MVKSRKATVKARPLPNIYNTQNGGISKSGVVNVNHSQARYPGTSTASNNMVSTESQTTTANKRPIFQHLSRLQHGLLRFRRLGESPTSVVANTKVWEDRDRKFVFVPAGYSWQNDRCLQEILTALELPKLPPLLVVTAATDGAVEETMDDTVDLFGSTKQTQFVKACEETDLTEEEERELLKEKTHEILQSTLEFCREVGAWIVPHRPRRGNGAAEILLEALPTPDDDLSSITTTKSPVILGMIGLDQHDKQDGFTDLVVNHMVPVGTDIPQVAELFYDPESNRQHDNTPCPQLTHLLIFQRRQEMRAFRDRILRQVPDVFLAFGRTTPYGKKSLFSALTHQAPLALITHTSPEVDHLSWMLRHADREMQKVTVGATTPEFGTAMDLEDPTHNYKTIYIPSLPDLQVADPELSCYLSTWPAHHRPERVVLADPRKVGGVRFQQLLLRAVNAAYYTPEARTVAIKDAHSLLKAVEFQSQQHHQTTERYHLGMVLATLTGVAAAVFYAKIYGSDPPPSLENRNPYQIALFAVTLLAPLLIVMMKKRYDHSSKLWSMIQQEAAKLESAIFAFRTMPNSYGQAANPADDPLDSFLRERNAIRIKELEDTDEMNNSRVISPTPQMRNQTKKELDIEAPTATETTQLLPPTDIVPAGSDQLVRTASRWHKSTQEATDPFNGYQSTDIEAGISAEGDKTSDNDSMLLTIQEYIVYRVEHERNQKEGALQKLEKRHSIIETTIKIVLGSTTLLALLSKQWLIPVVLGVSSAFVASQDFRKYQTRMDQGKITIQQLNSLLKWWQDLPVDDKVLATHADRLVETAEAVILADRAFTY